MTTYVAFWKMHGESFSAEADTKEELRVKIFGQASAPPMSEVSFYEMKTEDS